MSEKRKDPDDGKAYTFDELAVFYKGKYKKKEIEAYWETCTPLKAKKAKAKAKEKEKAEPKAKAKPKAKEKAKAKAKPKAAAEPKEPVKRLRVGDKIPEATLFCGLPGLPTSTQLSIADFCKDKKVVLVGLPGAFTPTWSSKQIPGYIAKEAELKAKGISAVICYAVNDGAVIEAWAQDQKTAGTIVSLYGDPSSALTKALGLTLKDKGPMGVLGNPRSKRFSMLLENGVMRSINVAASKADPAGDEKPDISLVEKMLEDIDKLEASKEPKAPKVKVDDAIPVGPLHKGFGPPEMIKMDEFCKGKKVVIVGLPGAFTPTWCLKQVPGYLAKQADLKAKGVTDIVVVSVNDGAVMKAWAAKHDLEGSMVTMLGDPGSKFTRQCGLVLDDSRVMGVLGNPRCKRYSMLVDDGTIKAINVACTKDDPSGDADPTVSMVDKMLADLSA